MELSDLLARFVRCVAVKLMTIAENITLSTDCGKKYRVLGTSQIIAWDKVVLRDATTAILSQK